MKNYKKIYRDLEMQVLHELRTLIEKSKQFSKHNNHKVINCNLQSGYLYELAIIDDSLTFISVLGLQYNFTIVSLEELIDVLMQNKK